MSDVEMVQDDDDADGSVLSEKDLSSRLLKTCFEAKKLDQRTKERGR